ncbi:MAG: hypothetical protein Q9207_007765 [Kuettlingeria erythrocarpa]
MPGGGVPGKTPVPVGAAAPVPVPVPLTGNRLPAELGIGYGAVVAEVVKDAIGVAEGAGVELVVGAGRGTDDDKDGALDEGASKGVVAGGDSSEARVEVTVPFAMVMVRVSVEVEDNVVVGSEPGAPASRDASDARGRARSAEVRRRRMIAEVVRVARSQKSR